MKIDLDAIIKNKYGALYRRLPRFVISLLKRVVHQDNINYILDKYSHLTGVEFASAVLDELNVKRECIDAQQLDPSQRYIIAANHPLGGLDAFALAEAVHTRTEKVRFVVNDMLMNLEPLRPIFTPINKYGSQNSSYAKSLAVILASDEPVVYFPAGVCSRRIKGVITDLSWKKNFVQKAKENNREILPVYIDSANSNFFYNFASLRKRLGIKANIEMIFLPSELFKKRNSPQPIRVIFGKPVEVDDSMTIEQWSEYIRRECYALADK